MSEKVLFGHAEIVAFAEKHDDERVRVMLKRYLEARSNAAKWCGYARKLELKIHNDALERYEQRQV
jgi:hypothetical protein